MNTLPAIGLLWVTLPYISSKATEESIFCQAPPVFPGDPAKVTCHFPEDLHHSKTSFGLFQRVSNGQNEESVLACSWADGQPQCVGEEGFHLASNVSDEVTVGIPLPKPKTFFCDTIPKNKNAIVTSCNFTFKASSTPSPTTVPPSLTEAPKTTEGRGDSDGHLFVTIQEVVIVGLVIADLLVIVIVLLWLRRHVPEKICTSTCQTSDEESAGPLLGEKQPGFNSDEVMGEDANRGDQAELVTEIQSDRLPTSENNVNRESQPACDEEAVGLLTGEERQPTPEDNFNRESQPASDEEAAEPLSVEQRLPTSENNVNRGSQPASDEETVGLLTGEERTATYDQTDDDATHMENPPRREKDVPRDYCSPHHTPNSSAKALDNDFVGDEIGKEEKVRLLLLGKTGSGKSATGNTILGLNLFHASMDFNSVTSECERQVGLRGDTRIEIMDSPGLHDTNKTHEEISTIIVQSVVGMHPGPDAVLYVIPVGWFTAEDYDAYRRLNSLFDDSISSHVILIFTHGDELERQETVLADMLTPANTPQELKEVLRECGHRYLVFNNKAVDPQPQVDELLAVVRRLVVENGGRPYSCPKYSKIGESLEEEVNKRLEKFEKRDLQRRKYVQELEKQMKAAELAAKKTREEFLRREEQREQETRKEEERRKMAETNLEQQLAKQLHVLEKLREELKKLEKERTKQEQERQKERKISEDEQRELKKQKEEEEQRERERELIGKLLEQESRLEQQRELERAERLRLERERQQLLKKHEEQRRKEMEEMGMRNREQQEIITRKLTEERETEKQRDRDRQTEMERLKDSVVKKEEQSFLTKMAKFVA